MQPPPRLSGPGPLIAAALGALALAAPATAHGAPVLSGTNHLTVDDTGGIVVTLPQTLALSPQQPPVATFDDGSSWQTVILYALKETAAGGQTFHPSVALRSFSGSEYHLTLPAGDYLLALASTTGRPVRATLTLPGLSGESRFSPTTKFPVGHRVRELRPSTTEENTLVVSAMHPHRGVSFATMRWTEDRHPGWAGSVQRCDYIGNRDDQAADGEPGCPGGYVYNTPGSAYRIPQASVSESHLETTYSWTADPSKGYGWAWSYTTLLGPAPDATLESWSIDIADLPRELVEPPAPAIKKPKKRAKPKRSSRRKSCRRSKPKSRASAETTKKRSKRCRRPPARRKK